MQVSQVLKESVVTITDVNGEEQNLTTNENGNYAATVPTGDTIIDIDESTLPGGSTQTEGDNPTTVTVPEDGIASDVDGFSPPEDAATVAGIVYEDTNGNGTQDANESGIEGVTITVTDIDGHTQTLTTDENGSYEVTVPAGDTIVDINESTLPGGSTQTEGDNPTTLTAVEDETVEDVDGYEPPVDAGEITGVIYEDTNGNGVQDADEPGIEGVEVTITDSEGNEQTLSTDENGTYTATVPSGEAVIDIDESTLPANMTQTEGTDPTTVTVPANGTATDVDGFEPSDPADPENELGTLIGIVYEDTNGNGVQDADEPGIEGVTVTITDSQSNIQTLITDENGSYETIVPAGTVLVDIEQSDIDETFTQTEGTDPTTVTVPVGGEGTDVDGFAPKQLLLTVNAFCENGVPYIDYDIQLIGLDPTGQNSNIDMDK